MGTDRHLAALVIAFILRLAWGLVIPIIPISDSHAYDVFASNIVQAGDYGWEIGKPTAYWPVGTSALYAGIYALFGSSQYTAVMLFQVVEGVAIVAVAIALGNRWFGYWIGLAVGWLLAFWPLLIQYTTILASELHFIFLVLMAFWFAGLEAYSKVKRAIVAGCLIAAAAYVRPLALVMTPLLFIHEYLPAWHVRKWLISTIVASLAMIICIAPWTVRNWIVFDRFVVISTNGGANLWMGNNPSGATGYMQLPDLGILNEADRDKELGRQAKEFIYENPSAFIERSFVKLIRLNDRETIGVSWNETGIEKVLGEKSLVPLKIISSVYWLGVLAFASIGVLVFCMKQGMVNLLIHPALLVWFFFTLVHVITVAGDRYHIPSIPFVALFAAYALSMCYIKIVEDKQVV